MQDVYRLINKADNIVIASPIHFSELTGSLLQFASRLQYLWISSHIRKDGAFNEKNEKNGVVILVGNGYGNRKRPGNTAKVLLHQMNANLLYDVRSFNTNNSSAKNDIDAMQKVRQAAESLNSRFTY